LKKNIDNMGSDTPFPEPFYGEQKKEEKDKCVSCGEETPYTITTHVDQRKHYVEGAGQLCAGCYNKIYN